jgi:plasmid stability protein
MPMHLNLPDTIHQQLKIAVAENKTSMRAVVIKLLEDWLKRHDRKRSAANVK